MKIKITNIYMILFIISISLSIIYADKIRVPKLEWNKIDFISNPGDELPEARRDFAIGYYPDQSQMIIFGGRTKSGEILGDTWIFSFSSKTWRKPVLVPNEQAVHPPARYGMVYGNDQPPSNSYRTTFVITTGKGENDEIYNDVWSFDFIRECWVNLIPTGNDAPAPRYEAIGGIDFTRMAEFNQISKEYLILSHGRNNDEFFDDTYLLKLDGRSQQGDYSQLQAEWIKLNTIKNPGPREALTGTVISGDRLVLFGGCESDTKNCTSDGYYLDVDFLNFREVVEDNKEWVTVHNECARPKKYAASVRGTDQAKTNYFENDNVFFFGGEPDTKYGNDARGEISIMDMDDKSIFGIIPSAKDENYPSTVKGAAMLGTVSNVDNNEFNIILYGGEPLDPNEEWPTDIWALKVSNVEFTYYPDVPDTMTKTECYELLPEDEIKRIESIKKKESDSFSKFIIFALTFLLIIPVSIITSRSMNCFTKRWNYIFSGLGIISIILTSISIIIRINNKDTIFILECIVLFMLFVYLLSALLRPKQPNINLNKGQVNAAGIPVNTTSEILSVKKESCIPSPASLHTGKNINIKQTSSSVLLIDSKSNTSANNKLIEEKNLKNRKLNSGNSNKKADTDSESIISNNSSIKKTDKKRLTVVDNVSENESLNSDKGSPFLSPVFINPNMQSYEEDDESEESYVSDIEEDEEEILKNKYLLMAKIWLNSNRLIGLIIFFIVIGIVGLSLSDKSSKMYKKNIIFILWVAIIIITYIISAIVAWKIHSSMALIKAKRMSFRSSEPLEPNHGPSWSGQVDHMKRFSLISEGSYGKTSAYEDMCATSNYSQSINANLNTNPNANPNTNPNFNIPPLPVTPNFLNTHGVFTTQQNYTNYQTPSPPSSLINQQSKYNPAFDSSITARPGSFKEIEATLNNNNKNKFSGASSIHSYNSKDETRVVISGGGVGTGIDNKLSSYQTSGNTSSSAANNNIMNLNISTTQSHNSQIPLIQPMSSTPTTSNLIKTDSYISMGHMSNNHPTSIHSPSPILGTTTAATTLEVAATTPTSSIYESENEIELPRRTNTIDNLNDKEVMVVMTVPKRKLAVVNL